MKTFKVPRSPRIDSSTHSPNDAVSFPPQEASYDYSRIKEFFECWISLAHFCPVPDTAFVCELCQNEAGNLDEKMRPRQKLLPRTSSGGFQDVSDFIDDEMEKENVGVIQKEQTTHQPKTHGEIISLAQGRRSRTCLSVASMRTLAKSVRDFARFESLSSGTSDIDSPLTPVIPRPTSRAAPNPAVDFAKAARVELDLKAGPTATSGAESSNRSEGNVLLNPPKYCYWMKRRCSRHQDEVRRKEESDAVSRERLVDILRTDMRTVLDCAPTNNIGCFLSDCDVVPPGAVVICLGILACDQIRDKGSKNLLVGKTKKQIARSSLSAAYRRMSLRMSLRAVVMPTLSIEDIQVLIDTAYRYCSDFLVGGEEYERSKFLEAGEEEGEVTPFDIDWQIRTDMEALVDLRKLFEADLDEESLFSPFEEFDVSSPKILLNYSESLIRTRDHRPEDIARCALAALHFWTKSHPAPAEERKQGCLSDEELFVGAKSRILLKSWGVAAADVALGMRIRLSDLSMDDRGVSENLQEWLEHPSRCQRSWYVVAQGLLAKTNCLSVGNTLLGADDLDTSALMCMPELFRGANVNDLKTPLKIYELECRALSQLTALFCLSSMLHSSDTVPYSGSDDARDADIRNPLTANVSSPLKARGNFVYERKEDFTTEPETENVMLRDAAQEMVTFFNACVEWSFEKFPIREGFPLNPPQMLRSLTWVEIREAVDFVTRFDLKDETAFVQLSVLDEILHPIPREARPTDPPRWDWRTFLTPRDRKEIEQRCAQEEGTNKQKSSCPVPFYVCLHEMENALYQWVVSPSGCVIWTARVTAFRVRDQFKINRRFEQWQASSLSRQMVSDFGRYVGITDGLVKFLHERGCKNLVISANGPLFRLPYLCLPSRGRRFLVQDFYVSVTPCLWQILIAETNKLEMAERWNVMKERDAGGERLNACVTFGYLPVYEFHTQHLLKSFVHLRRMSSEDGTWGLLKSHRIKYYRVGCPEKLRDFYTRFRPARKQDPLSETPEEKIALYREDHQNLELHVVEKFVSCKGCEHPGHRFFPVFDAQSVFAGVFWFDPSFEDKEGYFEKVVLADIVDAIKRSCPTLYQPISESRGGNRDWDLVKFAFFPVHTELDPELAELTPDSSFDPEFVPTREQELSRSPFTRIHDMLFSARAYCPRPTESSDLIVWFSVAKPTKYWKDETSVRSAGSVRVQEQSDCSISEIDIPMYDCSGFPKWRKIVIFWARRIAREEHTSDRPDLIRRFRKFFECALGRRPGVVDSDHQSLTPKFCRSDDGKTVIPVDFTDPDVEWWFVETERPVSISAKLPDLCSPSPRLIHLDLCEYHFKDPTFMDVEQVFMTMQNKCIVFAFFNMCKSESIVVKHLLHAAVPQFVVALSLVYASHAEPLARLFYTRWKQPGVTVAQAFAEAVRCCLTREDLDFVGKLTCWGNYQVFGAF